MSRLSSIAALLLLLPLVAACGSSDQDASGSGDSFLSDLPPGDWSPEEAGLLFMSSRDGNAEVYFRQAEDTTWINLTNHEAQDNWAEWSPDGSRVAFHSDRNGRLNVFVMNADGTGVLQVSTSEDHDYLPSWTPDGRILFTSWRQEETDSVRAQHVYVVNADGTDERRLNLAGGAPVVGAVYAPDGQSLVYGQSGEDRSSELWLANADGSEGRRITSGAAFYGAPAFSPDGRLLAYYADEGSQSSLLVQDLATGVVDTALTGGKHWYPRWSPDGRWMLSCSELDHGDFDILAFPVDGSRDPVTLVSGSPRDCEGRWVPPAVTPPAVAP